MRTRLALLAAARGEFADFGFGGTSTRGIAERAGVSAGTFYQYFSDKNSILGELAGIYQARAAEVSLGVVEPSAPSDNVGVHFEAALRERLRRLCAATLAFRRQDPGLQLVFRERRCADSDLRTRWLEDERELIDRITNLLERWQIEEAAARAVALYGMVDGTIEALVEHGSIDDERVLDLLVDALVGVVMPHAKDPTR